MKFLSELKSELLGVKDAALRSNPQRPSSSPNNADQIGVRQPPPQEGERFDKLLEYKGLRIRGRRVGWVRVHADHIETHDGRRPITAALRAEVETAGNLAMRGHPGEAAILGGVTGAVLSTGRKQETLDKRELYLLIEDMDWGTVISCAPDDGLEVRKVAQVINRLAKACEAS